MTQRSSILEHAGMPLDALPEEVLEQLHADPALKAEFEAQARVVDLLQLKNYEQPAEALFGRVQHRVAIRLQQSPGPAVAPLMGPLPAWARVLAVVVVMLGLSVLTHREMLQDPTVEPAGLADLAEPSTFWDAPEVYEMPADPFSPFMLTAPVTVEFTEPFVGLSRQLEQDFEFLGLAETNQLERTSLLPVRFTPGK